MFQAKFKLKFAIISLGTECSIKKGEIMSNRIETLEIKNMLGTLVTMLDMLIPKKVSVSYLADSTNKSRQSIRQFLLNNFEYEKDYWKEGGKIYVDKDTAITILSRRNTKKYKNTPNSLKENNHE